jgi:hypothetical protein
MAPEMPPLFEDPAEPLFILRGSDPAAYLTMVIWSCLKSKRGDPQGAQHGIEIAFTMEAYARCRGMDADQAFAQWVEVLSESNARLQALVTCAVAERVQLGQRLQ